LNPEIFKIIETKRLFIRQINLEEFFKIGNELQKILDNFTNQSFFSESNSKKTLIFSLTHKVNDTLLGFIFFNPSNGRSEMECYFILFPQYTGNGYAIEALKKSIEFVFSTLTIDTLCAYVRQDNKKGWLVAERSGMKYMGDIIVDQKNKKVMKFSMNKDEFDNMYHL